mgnify:CR=1 FL=1
MLLVAFAALQAALATRIAPGVEVGGVSVGDMSVTEAEEVLEAELLPAVETVTLWVDGTRGAGGTGGAGAGGAGGSGADAGGAGGSGGDGGAGADAVASAAGAGTVTSAAGDDREPLSLTLAALGIAVDVPATARAARAHGRHELPFGLTVWLPFAEGQPRVVVRVDAQACAAGLEAVRAAVDVPARPARLKLSGDGVRVVPARDGTTVDAVALVDAVTAAVAEGRPYAGEVPLTAVPPEVSTAEAEERAAAAATYLSRPVTLRLGEARVELTPAQMADMLAVNTGADADLYPLTFDNPTARARLRALFAWAEEPAQNADIVVHEGGGVTVTPSRDGLVLDMAQLVADLDAAASGGGLRQVVVALRPELPELTTDDVESMGLASLGSQFTTYFDPANAGRATNIALAAKIVDGTIVQPGAVFSLNATLGPRSVNRGFDYAPVIAGDGVLRQGVGGGICQYATTLFNAVFFAGLPVVERHAHGLLIAHYPVGRDATVSWGGPDLKFRNDTGKPVMIRSWVEGGALTVAIVGKTGRTVTYTTSHYYDIRKTSSTRADPRVVYDDDLPNGVVRWEPGADGKSVRVVRTVKDDRGEVLFRETYVSVYAPRDWIKRIGTGT